MTLQVKNEIIEEKKINQKLFFEIEFTHLRLQTTI